MTITIDWISVNWWGPAFCWVARWNEFENRTVYIYRPKSCQLQCLAIDRSWFIENNWSKSCPLETDWLTTVLTVVLEKLWTDTYWLEVLWFYSFLLIFKLQRKVSSNIKFSFQIISDVLLALLDVRWKEQFYLVYYTHKCKILHRAWLKVVFSWQRKN